MVEGQLSQEQVLVFPLPVPGKVVTSWTSCHSAVSFCLSAKPEPLPPLSGTNKSAMSVEHNSQVGTSFFELQANVPVTPPTNSPMSEIQQFVTGLAHIQHFPFAICVNICHVHFFLLRYFIYISNILAILSIIPSKTNSFICRSSVWCITCSILICLYLAGQFWGWLWPGGGGLLRRAACFPVGRRSPAGATELCSEPSTCSPHPG